ncbi:MAG TPA: TusE/DsrC/DsvC family sulfur relay protein [Gammaproteobacteria bacterium]|nr:TusE/DsrC/DsvC family sulfur relay protein [Gammaproteobacteria bacterium]
MSILASEMDEAALIYGIHEDEPEVLEWDRQVAESLAREEGLELTDERWEVVQFLRNFFMGNGELDRARDLTVVLNQRFRDRGGLRYLYRLFPGGPVRQGCHIAGIPVPGHSVDPSFGTVS